MKKAWNHKKNYEFGYLLKFWIFLVPIKKKFWAKNRQWNLLKNTGADGFDRGTPGILSSTECSLKHSYLPPLHIAKVYSIEGYRNYDVWFLQTMFKIKILS